MYSDSRIVRVLGALACVLVLALLVACGGSVNLDKSAYDQVQVGMSTEQVLNILGYTDIVHDNENAESQYMGVWKNGTKEIRVVFVNDKVYSKSKKGF
jgi:hypothetical protein